MMIEFLFVGLLVSGVVLIGGLMVALMRSSTRISRAAAARDLGISDYSDDSSEDDI